MCPDPCGLTEMGEKRAPSVTGARRVAQMSDRIQGYSWVTVRTGGSAAETVTR